MWQGENNARREWEIPFCVLIMHMTGKQKEVLTIIYAYHSKQSQKKQKEKKTPLKHERYHLILLVNIIVL